MISRAHPPRCTRRGGMLNDDQENGCVEMSVAGASIRFGDCDAITGFCAPVMTVLDGRSAVFTSPSRGKSGSPIDGVSWRGLDAASVSLGLLRGGMLPADTVPGRSALDG